MKRILLIIMLLGVCCPLAVYAQTPGRVSLEGTVTDYDTKETLPGCVVTIPQIGLWAITDENGKFRITSVATGTYDIEISYLGYEKLVYNVNLSKSIANLEFKLKPLSLALNSVVVTATKGSELNTTNRIDKQAMEHIQAKTIKGYMELLPGAIIENSNLNTASVISLRDVGNFGAGVAPISRNAFGTSVIVDGAKVNDKAALSSGNVNASQAPDGGFDTRQISTDNVESIEVITGVASAEYGDLNTGAVIIKTKSGRTPFEISVSTDPSSKIFTLSKGMKLGDNAGVLNLSADYAKSFDDIRTDEKAYAKESFSARYNNLFNKNSTPLSFNFSVSGFMSQGTTKNDPDKAAADETKELKNYSLTFNANGEWQVKKTWLTSLRYNINYRFNNGFSRDYAQVGSPEYRRLSMVEGISISDRHDGAYMADKRNESKAAYTNIKLAADISNRYGNAYNKFTLGVEWDNSGNRGRGEYYIGEQPNTGILRNIDARDYIPFINTYNAFAENKFTLPFNQNRSSVTFVAGIRYSMIDTDVLDQSSIIDPRFNLKYSILQNNRGHNIKELSIRGGWGIQSSMPYLQFMYNLPTYNDRALLTWSAYPNSNPPRAAGRVYETTIITPEMKVNPDLKIQRSNNFEFGLDFDIFGVKGSVVYFNEQINNGYRFDLLLTPETYKEYNLTGIDDKVSVPTINNGVLYFKNQPVPYVEKGAFRSFSRPNNTEKINKWGIEYTLNFGQIPAIRTSVVLSGQYIHRKNYSGGDYLSWDSYSSNAVGGNNNPFAVAFTNGTSMYWGNDYANLTSHINFITHIPKIRLITSLTIQAVLMRKEQSIPVPDLYHIDENGNRIYGDYSKGWKDDYIYRDPVAYKGIDNIVLPFNPSLYSDPVFGQAFLNYRGKVFSRNYFIQNSYKPYFMGKIRVTKEISKVAQVSFYVNNFTSSNPQRLRKWDETYITMNSEFYFGAEVKLKF